MGEPDTDDAMSSPLARVLFVALLTTAMAVGPYVVYALGALAPLLSADLGISRAELGVLGTVAVGVGCLSAPVLGGLVDRVGGQRLVLVLFAGAAGGLASSAVAPSYAALVAAMALCGIALAMIDPVTNWLISTHVPRPRQGLMVGIKQSGVQLGALFAGGALPAIGLWLGWRGAMLVSAAVPLLALVLAWFVIPADPWTVRHPRGRERRRTPLGPSVRWLAAYAGCMGAGLAPVSTYLPLFAHERAGLSVTVAGAAAAVIALSGVTARILWGHHAHRISSTATTLYGLATLSVLATLMLWGSGTFGVPLLWIGAVLFGASAGAWHAVGMLSLVREGDIRVVGRAAGVVQMTFYLGFLLTPPLFGYSADRAGSYHLGWGGVTVLFLTACAIAGLWRQRVEPGTSAAPAHETSGYG